MARSLQELRQYLAGEWLFENNFNDTSGNSNHGAPADIEWASTQRGLKPRFNGSSSYVDCGNDNSLDITTAITLSAWVRPTNDTEQLTGVISKRNGWGVNQIPYGITQYNNYFRFETYTDVYRSATSPTFTIGEWCLITAVFDGSTMIVYKNGKAGNSVVFTGTLPIQESIVAIGKSGATGVYARNQVSDARIYNTALTATEVLALYNATSGEYGPRIAEISYQHDPLAAIPEQPGTVLRIGGKLSGDAVDTISDRSGEGNDATIFGAMPADDHYFIGGRRFDGDDDYLDCGFDSSLDLGNNIFIDVLFSLDSLTVGEVVVLRKSNVYALDLLPSTNKIRFLVKTDDIDGWTAANDYDYTFVTGVQYNISGCFDGENVEVFVNGVSLGTRVVTGNVPINGEHVFIGGLVSTLKMQGNIKYGTVGELFDASRFNALALLPIFELNFRDYPDNPDAVWLDNTLIPFSSGVVGSNGTFSVDGDQLICGEDTSTCTFRNNFKFDGQEYVTVTIDGIEYSGTGTITQGSVTVSIAQGSNKITIAADNGDVIDKVRITFRDMV